jgi:hypothetical protein
MNRIIPYINHEVKKLEAELQVEESGTKVAIIQGKLAGYNSMISVLNEIEITDFRLIKDSREISCKYNKDFKRWLCEDKDFHNVSHLWMLFTNVESIIDRFNKTGEDRIKEKKDWLFYEAEKSRDLHFVKGWFFSFNILNDWKIAIKNQYEYLLKRKNENLDFETEEEI